MDASSRRMSEKAGMAQPEQGKPEVLYDAFNRHRGLVLETERQMEALFGHYTRMARYQGHQGNTLVYSAQPHANHGHFELMRACIDSSVRQAPTDQEWVVLAEASINTPRAEDMAGKTDEEIIEQYGDGAYTRHLAHEHDLPLEVPDITSREFVEYLKPGSEEVYALYRFMSLVYGYQKSGKIHDSDAASAGFDAWMTKNNEEGGLFRFLGMDHVTPETLYGWHEEYLDESFDMHRYAEKYISPNMPGTPTSDMALYRSNIRDGIMLDKIYDAMDSGKNVIAAFGASHLTLHDLFLQEYYGKPLVSRAGQMSADIALGRVNNPQDIMTRAQQLSRQIDIEDDPLTQSLLGEELHMLQNQLSAAH